MAASSPTTSTRTPPGAGTAYASITSCGWPSETTKRVEVVEPVGTPAEHPERQRELRVRRGPDAREPHAAAAAHRASAAHSSSPSDSARAVGATPAHSSTSVGALAEQRTQRAAEHLASLGEPTADEREELGFRRHRHRRCRPPAEPHEHRLDLRAGNEHGGRHRPEQRRLGVVRHLHRHCAVLLATGSRGEALAHLTLDHHHDPGDGRRRFEEPHHHRDGDVVGKVGDARPLRAVRRAAPTGRRCRRRRRGRRPRPTQARPPHRAPTAGRVRARRRARRRGRVHPARAAPASASRGRGRSRGPGRPVCTSASVATRRARVRIGEKVLAEALLRTDPVLGEQRAHRPARREHLHGGTSYPPAPLVTLCLQPQPRAVPQPQADQPCSS